MLSAQEAAEYCGFPSVKRFASAVRVRPVNYGNCVRYDRDRLDEWLDTLSQSEVSTEDMFVEAAGSNESARDRH
jgi:hypothetical protein